MDAVLDLDGPAVTTDVGTALTDESTGREALPVDRHVGFRLRLRRLFVGLTQPELANQVGLTYQQIQKYERAESRISASKLHALAVALGVPISYFFEGLNGAKADSFDEQEQVLIGFLASADGLGLAAAFMRIDSPRARRQLVRLAEAIVCQEDGPGSDSGTVAIGPIVQSGAPESRHIE